MTGFDLEITLLEDAVFSERSATEGGHRGLDYIPGAALLGAAAARLYPKLTVDDAFLLFHSGKVRFGNALPVGPAGAATFPVPLAWHHAKGVDPTSSDSGRLDPERIWNFNALSSPEPLGNKQPEQMRSGYVTVTGELIKPNLHLRLKTAIDPSTGRAREAALFGYQAAPAGTVLRASITADVDAGWLSQLQQTLSGELLLGRSRSAEYGRANVQIKDQSAIQHGPADGGEVTLWLLSDLAALDDYGQPTLCPKPEWLGLPRGELLVEKSFLRTHRYSPWNAYRRGRDMERQVIVQGSVLVFSLEQPLAASHLAAIDADLGAYREAGLGRVWINPPLLTGQHPQFSEPPNQASANGESAKDVLTTSPLITWLQARVKRQAGGEDSAKRARELATDLRERMADVRRLRGLSEETPVGPSASQWGAVLQAAKGRGDDLYSILFDNSNGLCKTSAPGWQDQFWDAEHRCLRKFADWIKAIWRQKPDRRLIQHLAREAMAVVKQENRHTERSNQTTGEASSDA